LTIKSLLTPFGTYYNLTVSSATDGHTQALGDGGFSSGLPFARCAVIAINDQVGKSLNARLYIHSKGSASTLHLQVDAVSVQTLSLTGSTTGSFEATFEESILEDQTYAIRLVTAGVAGTIQGVYSCSIDQAVAL
jgi:hypothetical protein